MTKRNQYLKGQTLKPSQISNDGVVLFTDGTNDDLMGTQATCEAYGYTYDKGLGMCRAFKRNPTLIHKFTTLSVKQTGTGNIIRQTSLYAYGFSCCIRVKADVNVFEFFKFCYVYISKVSA